MSARIEVLSGPSKGAVMGVSPDAPLSIGRGSDNGEGKIKDASISRVHGQFLFQEGVLVYRDNSRNGTWFVASGEREPSLTLRKDSESESVALNPGDRLMLGHTTLSVLSVASAEPAKTEPAAEAASEGRERRPSDAEADMIYSHPFSQLLAAGRPAVASDGEGDLSHVGKMLLGSM
jgi:hypothetical protein